MKTKIIEVDEVVDIIYQYWNQLGNTITTQARDYLVEQIETNSREIELTEK